MKGLRHSKGNEPMTCPACNEHVAASAFCDDCDSWLCTQCVLAHWRVRLTKMHRINLQECTACAEGCLVKAFCVDCDQWLCEQCILAHQRVLLTKKHRLQSNDEDLFMPGTPTPQAKTVNHDQPHESSSCNEIRHFSKVATAMDSNWNNCLGARSGANFSTNASTEQGKYATLSDGTTGGSMGKTIEASAGVIEEDSEQQDESESQLNSSGDEQTNDRNDDVCAVCGDGGDLVCCDGCTKAFHEACHIPVITSLPNDTWHCGLCTKEEDVRLEAPEMNREPLSEPSGATKRKATTGLTEGELKVCEVLLLQMLCHDDCNPFFVHVPESETEYHKKIKNPMDFSKIRPKLEQREYENINAFLQDIRLIFNNCIKYNKPKSEQWRSGRQLKTFFKKRISHLLPFVDYTDIPLGLVDTTGKLPKLQKLSSDDSGLSGNEASSETSKESTRPSSGKPGTSSMVSPLNTSESNSAVSVLSPKKQALYPKKQGLSPKKQELSTKKQELSTKKQELSPKKQKFSPKKQELCPKKQELSTKKQELSPQKKPMSPTNQPGPSSEKQGSSSKKTSVSLETKGPSSETLMVSSEKPVLFTDRTIEQTNSNAQSPPWIIEEY